jgi:hypothetical protein
MTDCAFLRMLQSTHPDDLTLGDMKLIAEMLRNGDLVHIDDVAALAAKWEAEDRAINAIEAARSVS